MSSGMNIILDEVFMMLFGQKKVTEVQLVVLLTLSDLLGVMSILNDNYLLHKQSNMPAGVDKPQRIVDVSGAFHLNEPVLQAQSAIQPPDETGKEGVPEVKRPVLAKETLPKPDNLIELKPPAKHREPAGSFPPKTLVWKFPKTKSV